MIVDVNVSLSRWPFRRLPGDRLPQLVEKLRKSDVKQAWVGSFDGLFHRDIGGVNARLAEDCREHSDLLIPFGSVNPMLPDWPEDLRRCDEEYHMPGIRLHPNYHGYKLDHPAVAELFALAERRGLIVQLVACMEDTRTPHPLVQVADVDIESLARQLAARPKLRLVILNGLHPIPGGNWRRLTADSEVYFDIAMLEGLGGIGAILQTIPLERVLFGSHFPLFYLEAALLKLRESELSGRQIEAISHGNADRLLALRRQGKGDYPGRTMTKHRMFTI